MHDPVAILCKNSEVIAKVDIAGKGITTIV